MILAIGHVNLRWMFNYIVNFFAGILLNHVSTLVNELEYTIVCNCPISITAAKRNRDYYLLLAYLHIYALCFYK